MSIFTGCQLDKIINSFLPTVTNNVLQCTGYTSCFGGFKKEYLQTVNTLERMIMPSVIIANRLGSSQSVSTSRLFGGNIFGPCYRWPISIDVGLNLQDINYYMQIWNGSETENVTIESVAVPEDSGIIVNSILPVVLRPYDGATIKLIVQGREGASRVADYVSVTMSNTQVLKSGISISRAAIFSLPIDWQEGITEKIEYLTNIITAYDETEQRIQIRTNPQNTLTYTYVLSGSDEIGLLDSLIWNWQGTVYMIPDWLRQSRLSRVSYGDFIITVTTPDVIALSPGESFVIIKDAINYEVLTCQSVSGNKITATTMAKQDWGADCVIVPLVKARMSDQIDISRPTGEIAKAVISFEVEAVK